MEPVTEWISKIENETSILYVEVADYFSEDLQFSEMVRNMAKEEVEHFQLILSAIDVIGDKNFDIVIDEGARVDYERPLIEGRDSLSSGTLTKEKFISLMVDLEFSLYNEIFIYAMNLAKELEGTPSGEFRDIDNILRHHRYDLETFLKSSDQYKKYLKKIRRLPEPWHKRVLVVDDSEALAEFFKAVLEVFSDVDVVNNGRDGLKRLSQHHYDLVVTDVEMPQLSGIEFFERALIEDGSLKNKFIFCVGNDLSDNIVYLKANDLKYLLKPVNMTELRLLVESNLS